MRSSAEIDAAKSSRRLFRRLRTAQVAMTMMRTSPTIEAATMTVIESGLFARKELGAAFDAASVAVDEEELEEAATVAIRVSVKVCPSEVTTKDWVTWVS